MKGLSPQELGPATVAQVACVIVLRELQKGKSLSEALLVLKERRKERSRVSEPYWWEGV